MIFLKIKTLQRQRTEVSSRPELDTDGNLSLLSLARYSMFWNSWLIDSVLFDDCVFGRFCESEGGCESGDEAW